MAGATGTWTNSVGGNVADAYNFAGMDTWNPFRDALGAWVTVEGFKAQSEATAAAQERTRTATTSTGGTPYDYADTGRARTGGTSVSPQMLVIGGVMLAGLFLLTR